MNIKFNRLFQDINEEIRLIEITLERIQLVKNDFSKGEKHYLTEPAIGTYLMNFYNGIENIIKRIAKEYYKKAYALGSGNSVADIAAIRFNNIMKADITSTYSPSL